jgi:hypothetical protein
VEAGQGRVRLQPEVLPETALAIRIAAVKANCTQGEIIDRLAASLPKE